MSQGILRKVWDGSRDPLEGPGWVAETSQSYGMDRGFPDLSRTSTVDPITHLRHP